MAKNKSRKLSKTKNRQKKKPKSLIEKLKHWLEKRGQGLPMTTIVIIIIVIIVLAVVILFFFGQFNAGKTAAESQQELGTSATQIAKCNAWAAGIISEQPCDGTKELPCPKQTLCDYFDRTGTAPTTTCYASETGALFTPSETTC